MKTVRNLFFLAVLVSFFAACHSDDDKYGNWKKVESFGGEGRVGAVSFTINEVAYVGLGIDSRGNELDNFYKCTQNGSEIIWNKNVAKFPGKARYGAVAFSDGQYGYVGLGYAQNAGAGSSGISEYFKDFWRYDPQTNTWEELAEFPGTARQYALGFYVKNPSGKSNAFVAYGYYSSGNDKLGALKDYWSYDIENDEWTEMDDQFGDKRSGACVGVIGETAYIFTGADGSAYPNDFIKFTPYQANKFTKLDAFRDSDKNNYDGDYGMIPRGYAVAFVVGKEEDKSARIYLATGARGSVLSDCWEYNPYRLESGMGYWDEVTSFPGGRYRQAAVAFVLGNIGYVTTGGANYYVPSMSNELSVDVTTYLFQPGVKDDDDDDE